MGRIAGALGHFLDHSRQAAADSQNYHQISSLTLPFDIHYSAEFRTPQQISIGASCCIRARTILNGRTSTREFGISLGSDTYLKEHCYLDAYGGFIAIEGRCAFAQGTYIHGGGGVTIGRNVITGPYCCIVASNHRFDSSELPIMLQGDRLQGIRIGHNVWLGANVVVLDGVVIADNCVIGAGTIVTKNVPSNALIFRQANQIPEESVR